VAVQRTKFSRSIIAIFLLITALWGLVAWGHSREDNNARKDCKTKNTATKDCDIPGMFHLGLDLQGGLSVVMSPKEGTAFDKSGLQKAMQIIRQRVDGLGVAEPDITLQGNNIVIQLPGLKDVAEALQLIGSTAKLTFRPVLGAVPATEKSPNCADPKTYPKDDEKAASVVMCVQEKDQTTGKPLPNATWSRLRLGPIALQGSDVATASASLPSSTTTVAGWQVDLKLTGDGAKKFAKVTGDLACNKGKAPTDQLAIVLDSVVQSHPQMGDQVVCHTGIAGGTAQISGTFSEKEAKDLALVLRYGALPVELQPSTTTTVSPTLGRQALHSGLYAGAIGLAIVFLYVLLFYRGLGLIVWAGLAVHASFTVGVVILLGQSAGFALTLAGIAGLIVSLGIATDSFIVYFERIKDEVHQGKTVRASVDRAWQSAWHTILAADLVTALAAAVLYFLAVGSVRGFALMLGLATGLDLFVSRLFMHPAVWLLAQTKRFNESKRMGVRSVAGVGTGAPAPVAGGSK
jgi:preprotein translocase subunit SecD